MCEKTEYVCVCERECVCVRERERQVCEFVRQRVRVCLCVRALCKCIQCHTCIYRIHC